jgi:hypothetical protein
MRNPQLDRAYEAMGKYNEKMYLPVFRDHYGELVKSEFKYDSVDFYGVNYMIELKSRCCSSTDFIDTMFGYNKIVRARETLEHYSHHIPNYKVYFAFAFTDGLFIWEYNQTNYETNGGDSQKRIGGTSERGWDDYKDHYYILIENLIKISDKPVWIHPAVKENKEKSKNKNKSSIPEGVCWLKLPKN